MSYKIWTKEDDEVLKREYKRLSDREIGELLGRSRSSILNRRNVLGLEVRKQREWTEDEINYIKENYMTTTDAELAKVLKRPMQSVRYYRCNNLNLRKQQGKTKPALKELKVTGLDKVKATDLERLEGCKEDVINEIAKVYEKGGGHSVWCNCEYCKQLMQAERKLVKVNTKIRRARRLARES